MSTNDLETQQKLEDRYVMHTFARKPVEFVSGSGMKLQDSEGREYLDFIGGIGACSLGHCPEVVVQAVQNQAKRLIHVSNYYYIEKRGQLAKLISDLLNECDTGAAVNTCAAGTAPDGERAAGASGAATSSCAAGTEDTAASNTEPWQSFFANSGAEANECAIKLARLYARRAWVKNGGEITKSPRAIVVLEHSFHGRTLATLAATAQPVKQEWFNPLDPAFLTTPANDVEALERLFDEFGNQICGVLIEPIQGESGVHPLTPEFMSAIRSLTQKNDALMICDEVQCGIYRAGKHPFAFQHFNVVPDIVSMAKGIGGGVPSGVCAARASVAVAFEPGDHGSTFGGSNLAVSAMLATLTELSTSPKNYANHVNCVGEYFRQRLADVSVFENVRGMGLMIATDLTDSVKLSAPEIVSAALGVGLVLNYTGPKTLRFLPPLICEKTDVDVLIEKLVPLVNHSE